MTPRRTLGSCLAAVGGLAWAVVVLAPLYFLVLGSFRGQANYLTANPWLPTGGLTTVSFSDALGGIGRAFVNSAIVTVAVCAVVIVTGVPAAYGIIRGRGRASKLAYGAFLIGLAVPLEGTIVAIFVIVVHLGLYDTLAAIILPTAAFSIAITILILVAFLRDVPGELYEAMQLDGAGHLRMVRSLVFPMARPPLLGIGVFVALNSWNSLLLPLVTTTSASQAVLPVELLKLQSSDAANYPAILASVVLSSLPIIVLYIVGRRHLINGLVIGAAGTGK
ncbi:MAG TPA: carbohydrate ABC transporter permease [Acidimicrobiales bacterium]|nr:carbohydrate ABC transporter permease [Acidimicrobiales bacterium]